MLCNASYRFVVVHYHSFPCLFFHGKLKLVSLNFHRVVINGNEFKLICFFFRCIESVFFCWIELDCILLNWFEEKNEWIIWMNEKIASEYFKKIKILITTGNACLTYLEKKNHVRRKNKFTFIWNVLICISWCSFTSFLSLYIIRTIRLLVCLIEIQECRLQMQFLHRISLSIWVIIIWNVFNIRQFNRILNDDRKSDKEYFFFFSLFEKFAVFHLFTSTLSSFFPP